MQIANEFGREGGGGGMGEITGDYFYETKPISQDIPLPTQETTPSLPISSKGGAFIIGLIILGMRGFRA